MLLSRGKHLSMHNGTFNLMHIENNSSSNERRILNTEYLFSTILNWI